ncbi:hypothetical protein AB1207_01225 [Kineococcus endophyticus]|uniref:Uncharacterized protein n=1 Tax=Kineococcus endophyticus TaxID=1181883 RepID=A0ABV3P1D3_9ACTN
MTALEVPQQRRNRWPYLAVACSVLGAMSGAYLLTVALREGAVWAPAAMLVAVNVVNGVMGWRWR